MPTTRRGRCDPSLLWSPLIEALRERAREAGGLRVLVTPFASVEGIEPLLEGASNLKVVCRWSAADIASGIADLDIYPLLRDRGVKLYLHPRIHLKLYIFADGTAFHSSANATGKGLGLSRDGNLEVGATTLLTSRDWDHVYELFDQSVPVDDLVYERAVHYQQAHRREGFDKLPELVLAPSSEQSHSISSLPVSPSPETFAQWHAAPEKIPRLDIASYEHDRFLFSVPSRLNKRECVEHLRTNFKESAFVRDVVSLIKREGAARFGLVKAWLQETCSDRPVPYRWELTKNTQVLYAWLAYFFDEISWDRPHHSMVIRWTAAGAPAESPEAGGAPSHVRRRRLPGVRCRRR